MLEELEENFNYFSPSIFSLVFPQFDNYSFINCPKRARTSFSEALGFTGRRGGLMVSAFFSRSGGLGSSAASYSWARHLTLTVSLRIQVYKRDRQI